ncbi:unnamed protein product, partial [Brachionus calyciflorus]
EMKKSLGESALKLALKANIKIPPEILSEWKLEEELSKNPKDEVQQDEEKFYDALEPEVTDPNFIDILKALTKSININKSLRIETLKSPSQNVSSWFERFELLTSRWSKEEKGLEVQHLLEELRPNFSPCNLIDEFFSAKQNHEETIDKFAHRLLEYTREAKCEQRKLFEENICYVFRRGCEKKVQNFLVTDKTNDFNSLWSLAKTIENNNNEQEDMSLNKISEVPMKSFSKVTQSSNSKIKQNFNNREANKKYCHFSVQCNEMINHFQTVTKPKMTSPIKKNIVNCNYCKKPGHIDKDCRLKLGLCLKFEKINSSSKYSTSCTFEINNKSKYCLIDTGALTSFISEKYASQENFKRDPIKNPKNWITANGSPLEVNGQCSLNLNLGSKIIKGDFIIAKNLSNYVIIGVDILKSNNCIFDFNKRIVRNEESIDLIILNDALNKKTIRKHSLLDEMDTESVKIVSSVSENVKPWRPSKVIKFENTNLNKEQIQKVKDLIDKYWVFFSRNDEDIGTVADKYGLHDVVLNDDKPIKQKPYVIPQARETVVKDCVEKMLKMNIIEPSNSNWASPNIENTLNKLNGSKFFTSFDFIPFCLCNAGATFQRIMELILNKLTNSIAYIDDIFIFSKTFEEHLEHLESLLKKLKEANMKVKTVKCKIARKTTMFLGYKISEKGIEIDESRVKVIKEYPKPKTCKHVKQFLGLASYYRQFIPNFSDIVDPLNKLSRKNVRFKWDENYEHGIENVIFYASHSLNKAERNYSTIERELLGIVFDVEKFKYYLYGREFSIVTDHNPLTYLNNLTINTSRLTRWRLKLSE